ncbi:hypothetical protein D3C73_1324390 [compost metagenome]
MRAVRQADATCCSGDFLHGNHVGQVAHACAAVFLTNRQTQQAHVAKLTPQIHRKLVSAIGFLGTWGDFLRRETRDRVAQHVNFFTKEKIQSW